MSACPRRLSVAVATAILAMLGTWFPALTGGLGSAWISGPPVANAAAPSPSPNADPVPAQTAAAVTGAPALKSTFGEIDSNTLGVPVMVPSSRRATLTITAGRPSPASSDPAGLAVDPASYRQWPSGARTFLSTHWGVDTADATFLIRNTSQAVSQAATVTVQVSNHNPLSQTETSASTYKYPLEPLAPGSTANISVPLDSKQCDIYVFVYLGGSQTTVLRTGNPAAC